MTNRVVYVLPDHSAPAGGVRVIYRHVELLAEAGYDAVVWHYANGFECDWFSSPAAVLTGPTLELDESDLLIVPEVMLAPDTDPAPGCRKVIYNQNHFHTFESVPADGYPDWTPAPSVWVSSTTSLEVLRRVHRDLPVEHIPYAIDLELFRPRSRSAPKIVWMPRKRPRESALLEALFAADERFAGVTRTQVDGLSEEQTAAELGTATVFIALGREEGFGLPVLESLAAGCPVVGYPAGGGAELFVAPGTHAVADADPIAIVEKVAELLAAEPSEADRSGYRAWVEANYPASAQLDRLIEAIGAALAKPASAGSATHPIGLLPAEPAGPSVAELLERIDTLTAQLRELTSRTAELGTELEDERANREKLEKIASTLESDLERSMQELGRTRQKANQLGEELWDLRDERAELRAATEPLVHLEEVTALLGAYKRDNDRLNERLDDEIRTAHDLRSSTSWRVTAPLRRVTGTLRGERRG
jgi:glycosyltransferase involved in cell wall biosynthesis